MERTPKGLYTPEFRAEAVKLVEVTGMSVARAAKQLSMPKSNLDNWVRAAREGKLAEMGKGRWVSFWRPVKATEPTPCQQIYCEVQESPPYSWQTSIQLDIPIRGINYKLGISKKT